MIFKTEISFQMCFSLTKVGKCVLYIYIYIDVCIHTSVIIKIIVIENKFTIYILYIKL